MSKIESNLKNKITADSKATQNIIIVTNAPIKRVGLKKIEGFDNIYEAQISGSKILALEKLKQIISIESNGENTIL